MASDSKFAKNSWKLRQSRQNQAYLAFSSQNRYDVRLANRRAPDVWFVLGFTIYLFLAPKWPGIPFFGKNNINIVFSIDTYRSMIIYVVLTKTKAFYHTCKVPESPNLRKPLPKTELQYNLNINSCSSWSSCESGRRPWQGVSSINRRVGISTLRARLLWYGLGRPVITS